jgi:hypothetical protein
MDLTKDDTYSEREDDGCPRNANTSGFFVGHPPTRTPTRYNADSVSRMSRFPLWVEPRRSQSHRANEPRRGFTWAIR